MPSTATTRNRFEKQGTGENANTWGTRLNGNTIDLVDAALDGMASYTLSAPKTLTSNNYAADEARMAFQNITGGTGGTITMPGVEKWYIVRNAASGTVTFTTGAGDTASIAAGDRGVVVCDGTNVYTLRALDYGAELPISSATPTLSEQLVTKAYVDGLSFSSALPSQSGNSGKYITTDGSTASWASITKTTVGLSNVDNTADASKPVSTAQQTALDLKANAAITISPGTGLTGGGTLAANRTLTADIASQAEAEAGTATTKLMTPERVAQAIDALGLAAADEATVAQYRANTADKVLTTDVVWSAADYVVVAPSGGSLTIDLSTGINFSTGASGQTAMQTPTNAKNGQSGVIVIENTSGTGSMTFSAAWKFPGGTVPTLSTTAGDKDVLSYLVVSPTAIYASLVKDYS